MYDRIGGESRHDSGEEIVIGDIADKRGDRRARHARPHHEPLRERSNRRERRDAQLPIPLMPYQAVDKTDRPALLRQVQGRGPNHNSRHRPARVRVARWHR